MCETIKCYAKKYYGTTKIKGRASFSVYNTFDSRKSLMECVSKFSHWSKEDYFGLPLSKKKRSKYPKIEGMNSMSNDEILREMSKNYNVLCMDDNQNIVYQKYHDRSKNNFLVFLDECGKYHLIHDFRFALQSKLPPWCLSIGNIFDQNEKTFVIDLETTGLDTEKDDIIELCIMDIKNNDNYYCSCVKTEKQITEENRKIHRITDEEISGGKTIDEVRRDLSLFLSPYGDKKIVIFAFSGASFDFKFTKRFSLLPENLILFDAKRFLKLKVNSGRKSKFEAFYQAIFRSLPPSQHRAKNDCINLSKVLNALSWYDHSCVPTVVDDNYAEFNEDCYDEWNFNDSDSEFFVGYNARDD